MRLPEPGKARFGDAKPCKYLATNETSVGLGE